MGDGTVALYDSGFYNIGVRPPGDDIGTGGTDPWGNPLSFSPPGEERRGEYSRCVSPTAPITMLGIGPDRVNVFTCNFQVDPASR